MSIQGRSKTSVVTRRIGTRMQLRAGGMSAALGPLGAVQTAGRPVGDGVALWPTAGRPRRALAVGLLVAIAFGVALYAGLMGRHGSSAAPARLQASTQVHPETTSQKKGLLSLPLAAQRPVSAALGADSPVYRMSASPGGFVGTSPTQHFRARFTRSGVLLSSAATHVGLSLRAVGYGASLNPLAQVAPRAKANSVSYAHPGLTETYANGPLGLEQGFTIARAPAGPQTGALTLAMAISGNAHPSLRAGGQSLTFRDAGRAALRYDGLSVTDADGRILHSWLQLTAGDLLLRVDAHGARYPLRIDPFIQQGEKLTGAGEKSEAGALGYSVATSIEGTT
jgi:hypothetical protein